MMQGLVRAALAASVFVATASVHAESEFRPIFDGKSLDGWSAPDMSYWSVTDGAIVAECTPDRPAKKNQFLVWQHGRLDDFELKLKFRITGSPSANAGIQIRSEIKEDGHAVGYQADIDIAGKWAGALYDEHTGRKVLAKRGEKTTIAEDGSRQTETLPGGDPIDAIKKGDWNNYHIIARGGHITLKINGKTTADVIDRDKNGYDPQGRLALQLHSGPPMKIEYKDIQLKRLPLTDGRKKIVFVAGRMSHGPGDHEFNAGVKLLTACLKPYAQVVVENVHDNGWPKDPTSLDNADALVMYMDGGGRHPVIPHLDKVEAFTKKGGGFMCMHYAVEVPKGDAGDAFVKWIGGYYETHWSINPHWTINAKLNNAHPIARGVKPFAARDEWYFNMRWKSNDEKTVTPILQGVPDNEARSGTTSWPRGPKDHIVKASGRTETVMWAIERADGGRGVGYTGGHKHANWGDANYRKLVLNALLWVAKAQVPEGGVESTVTAEQLAENLDPKKEA